MANEIAKISDILFNDVQGKSNKEIAKALTKGLSTTSFTAQNGYTQQIAVIEVLSLMMPLANKYGFLDKGNLPYGIGTQYMTMGYAKSVGSSTEIDDWVPEGALKSLDKYQATSTGFIQRKVINQYSEVDMKEYVRSASQFNELIQKEMAAGPATKARELREASRYLFGIDNVYLPDDYKAELLPLKTLINQNKFTVSTTGTRKSVVNYLKSFMGKYYENISNEYNLALTAGDRTQLTLGGTGTGVAPLHNTATKEDTVLIMSLDFKLELEQELGNVYNPAFWLDFTNLFGTVIIDTFADKGTFYIMDKKALGHKSMFDEYTNEYYARKSAFDTITKWRDNWQAVPFANGFSFKFSLTEVATVVDINVITAPVDEAEVKKAKAAQAKADKAAKVILIASEKAVAKIAADKAKKADTNSIFSNGIIKTGE